MRSAKARKGVAAGLGLLALVLLAGTPAAAQQADTILSQVGGPLLPVPESVRPQVDFWKSVFATYSEDQVVLHDTEDLRRIYSVLDFRDLRNSGMSDAEIAAVREQTITDRKEEIRGAMRRLYSGDADPGHLSPMEQTIAALFPAEHRGELVDAGDRIRAQRGLRERFAAGIATSRRYLPEIEAAFRDEGVPLALTRLALVESCFNVNAYSKMGAAGVWQFMPATGRLFMQVGDAVDERRDPVIAGRAAARFLRRAYENLGTWPLAITGYNHGPQGMARAVDELGTTDIGAIVRRYRGRAFGFASRNFYAELIAAVEVDARYREHFGSMPVARPKPTDWVQFPHYVPLRVAAKAADLSPEELIDLNPALTAKVCAGKLRIPRNYPLRVPRGIAAQVERRYARIAAAEKFERQRRQYVMHKVRRGQTLSHLAARYGTTVHAIKATNGLRGSVVRAGQVLRIPSG